MFTLICARKNGWVNNGEAGDLRRYLAHYDVIVMYALAVITGELWQNVALHEQGSTCAASTNAESCYAAINGILKAGQGNEWQSAWEGVGLWFQVISYDKWYEGGWYLTRSLVKVGGFNTLRPRQYARHFHRRHFQMHFLEKKCEFC